MPSFHDLPPTFPWQECAHVCAHFRRAAEAEQLECVWDPGKGVFAAGHWSLYPPLVFPVPLDDFSLVTYTRDLPFEPGKHVLLLMQAGAAAFGYFIGGEVVRTKALKRYVVRGKGRAQGTYLKTKGKSRYGSRLRLQNAKAILEEVNERLGDWWQDNGTPEYVFYNAPVRLWAELCQTKPAPPFLAENHVASAAPVPLIRIPLDLPVPTTDVMLRAYRSLSFGRIVHDRDMKAQ